MEKEMLYKSRSFSSCILAAYQLMSKNLWNLIKATWIPVLLWAVLVGVLLALNLPNEEVVAMGTAHFALYIGFLVVCVLGAVVASIWALSRLMSVLNEESRRWNFGRALWLTLNSIVIFIVIGLVIVAVAYAMSRLGGARLAHLAGNHFWLFLASVAVAIFVLCLLLLPLEYVAMKYLNERGMRFWNDLLSTYRVGLRRVSFIFITCFISGLITLILASIVMLPYFILTSAYYTSLMGYIMGDPSDLPGYFFVLFVLTTVVVYFLLWYVMSFSTIVMYFMYGSIEKRREEQRTARLEEQVPPALPTTEMTDIPPINLQS